MRELPLNSADVETTRNAIDGAFEEWLANPESSDNSLLILSSPITSISCILLDNINDWAMEKNVPLRLLEWVRRPEDTDDIVCKLRQQLGQGVGSREQGGMDFIYLEIYPGKHLIKLSSERLNLQTFQNLR